MTMYTRSFTPKNPKPEQFERIIDSVYSLIVPTKKSECQDENPYWYLTRRGNVICKLEVKMDGVPTWNPMPSIDTMVYVAATQKSQYCSKSVIDAYEHNRLYGAEDED